MFALLFLISLLSLKYQLLESSDSICLIYCCIFSTQKRTGLTVDAQGVFVKLVNLRIVFNGINSLLQKNLSSMRAETSPAWLTIAFTVHGMTHSVFFLPIYLMNTRMSYLHF